jgi:hypothetical protein
MIKKIALSITLAGLTTAAGFGATAGTDDASNYGGSWTNGSNGGTGFAAWDLTNNNNDGTTLFAGYFLGDSTLGTGNINTSGVSFGIYANPNGAFANSARNFDSALTVGQTFSIDMGVNFRNGDKGLNLEAGSEVFNFDVGGDMYKINGVDTGLAYDAASIFHLAFTQTSLAGGTYSVSRGASVFTGTYTGDASGFQAYNSNTNGGGDGDADNLYFNNLSVTNAAVPEPATVLLVGPALLGGVFFVRRRRA